MDHRDDPRGVVLELGVQERRVPQRPVVVQLVVDEAHHGEVKLQERQHHAIVHVLGQGLMQRVRREPRHLLSVHQGLVVDALDRDERLAQRVRLRDPSLELQRQRARARHELGGYAVSLVRRQHGEQVRQRQRVVEIPQRVSEARVPLFHEVVQPVLGLAFLQTVDGVVRLLRFRFFDLALVGAERAERIQQRLVRQEVDVLNVVVRLALAFHLLLGLSGCHEARFRGEFGRSR